MQKIILVLSYLFISFAINAQLVEDFTDGDFQFNPAWIGTVADFQINTNKQLQSNSTIAATSYLSTSYTFNNLSNKEWRFWVKQSFAGSGSNYSRVFLMADNSNLSLVQNGLYVQLGEAGSTDAIRLFKLVNGTSTQLCAGPDGQIVNSITASIRVKTDANSNYSLFVDFNGGENYSLLGSAQDNGINFYPNFGFLAVYTASNSTKFFYDNIYAGNEILDVTPPSLQSITTLSNNAIDILFSEQVTEQSATNLANFTVSNGIAISSLSLDVQNPSLVHATLSPNLTNGQTYQLTCNNINDISGNIASTQLLNFSYLIAEIPVAGDVIITEFMADPTPIIGLPEVEFVEIYNKSSKIFNLDGWKLGDNSTQGTIANGWMLPGEYRILTSSSSVGLFNINLTTGVSSFPGLNNSGDDISILSPDGILLDKITYADTWYRDDEKKAGGYSLERINLNHPCSDGNNWIATNSSFGGTPGFVNSVNSTNPDITLPEVIETYSVDNFNVQLTFNKGMDASTLMNTTISISPNLPLVNRTISGENNKVLTLTFGQAISGSQLYNLQLSTISDCWGNSGSISTQFVLPDTAIIGDIVINEILSNPLTGGQDYVELYNNSDKFINLKNWAFANHNNTSNVVGTPQTINKNYFLGPRDYVVCTKDSNFVLTNYSFAVSGKFLYVELPSYNNDSGTVYLLNNGVIFDKASYNLEWHFKLIDDYKGKSMERIDPMAPTNDKKNWHTAAETMNFGSPGRLNSQYAPFLYNGQFSFSSEIISPDGDGFEDILQITYQMVEPGLLGKAQIFDDRGRLVRTLFSNELLGTQGSFVWDGVTDNISKASIGVYVFYFETFSTSGEIVFAKKAAITVAGKI